MKRCCRCGRTKRLDLFHRDKVKPDGRRSMCATCANSPRLRKKPVIEWELDHAGIYRAVSVYDPEPDVYERTAP